MSIKKSVQSTIYFFYIYIFFSNFLIFLPVLVSIYSTRKINTAEVLLIESIYNIIIAIFEIPTGIIGDKMGHDKSVIIGTAGTALAFIYFAFARNIIEIIGVQICLGIFASFISGSDIGSISTFKEETNDDRDIFSDIYAISTASMLLSYIISGFIIDIDKSGMLVMLIEGLSTIVAAFFYYLYFRNKSKIIMILEIQKHSKEPQVNNDKSDNRTETSSFWKVIACGLLLGIISSGYLVSQLFITNISIPEKFMGIIYCFISFFTILFSKLTRKFNRITIVLMPLLFLIPVVKMKFMIVPFILLYAYLKSKVIPYVQEYVSSSTMNHKARNLSISSMINNVINSIFMLCLSALVSVFGFSYSMCLLALITILLLIYFFKNVFFNESSICENE